MSDYEDRHERAMRELRAEAESKKTTADRLRDRLAYVQTLRSKSAAANHVSEWLNIWIQNRREGTVWMKWSWLRRTLSIVTGAGTITLDRQEAESLFTWMYDHSKALKANADRIEAEIESKYEK